MCGGQKSEIVSSSRNRDKGQGQMLQLRSLGPFITMTLLIGSTILSVAVTPGGWHHDIRMH